MISQVDWAQFMQMEHDFYVDWAQFMQIEHNFYLCAQIEFILVFTSSPDSRGMTALRILSRVYWTAPRPLFKYEMISHENYLEALVNLLLLIFLIDSLRAISLTYLFSRGQATL